MTLGGSEPRVDLQKPGVRRKMMVTDWQTRRPRDKQSSTTSMLRPWLLLGLLVAFAFSSTGARADSVYLKNGRVIHNVQTRIEGERLVIIKDGAELAFPLSWVDRVEKAEVTASAPRPATEERANEPESPAPRSGAESAAVPTAATPTPTSASSGRRRRVNYNNGIDRISFELPEHWKVRHRRAPEGEQSSAYDFMDPSRLLSRDPGEVRYDLVISVRTVHPSVERSQRDHAISWLSRARLAFMIPPIPMELVKPGQARIRTIAGRKHYATRYWHEWPASLHRQDGIFLLYFPDDFEEEDRHYIFQWFVSYGKDLRDIDLDLAQLDAVVSSFRVRRLR